MYEISPYATFSVTGGRSSVGMSKTPTRGVTTSTLDYTVQFKTFGHPDGDNLNATAYPALPSAGFGHVKGKSSWHNQRYYNTDGSSHINHIRFYATNQQFWFDRRFNSEQINDNNGRQFTTSDTSR